MKSNFFPSLRLASLPQTLKIKSRQSIQCLFLDFLYRFDSALGEENYLSCFCPSLHTFTSYQDAYIRVQKVHTDLFWQLHGTDSQRRDCSCVAKPQLFLVCKTLLFASKTAIFFVILLYASYQFVKRGDFQVKDFFQFDKNYPNFLSLIHYFHQDQTVSHY